MDEYRANGISTLVGFVVMRYNYMFHVCVILFFQIYNENVFVIKKTLIFVLSPLHYQVLYDYLTKIKVVYTFISHT